MPKTFWNPARDQILTENYPILGPTQTSSLLGTSRRSVVNRASRLGLKAPYPKQRARPSFPPQSYSKGEKLLAKALLNLFRSPWQPTPPEVADFPNPEVKSTVHPDISPHP
jgi:hypothetical protein